MSLDKKLISDLLFNFHEINNKVKRLRAFALDDFQKLSHQIEDYYQFAREEKDKIGNGDLSSIKEFHSSLDQMTMNLQYHDIMSQKIDHVDDSNKSIISDLTTYPSVENKSSLVPQLSNFAELEKALLKLISQEYKASTELLGTAFIEIWSNNKAVVERIGIARVTLFNHSNNFDNIVDEISTGLDKIQELKGKEEVDEGVFSELFKSFTMESEREVFYEILRNNLKAEEIDYSVYTQIKTEEEDIELF